MKSQVRIESLLPRKVLHQSRQTPWAEWFEGTVLFADIAGFTPMAETLASLGAEGAEILTDILNRYFTQTIGTIHDAGGEVIKFSGDAVLCLFTDSDSLGRAMAAATTMQNGIQNFQNIRTPIKKFSLQTKIGIAEGKTMLAAIGDTKVRCDYLMAGSPVDLSIKAEQAAKPGEVILASNTGTFSRKNISAHRISKGLYKLDSNFTSALKKVSSFKIPKNKSQKSVSTFLIREVYEMVRGGFQRQFESLLRMTPAFLEFSGFSCSRNSFQLRSMHEFFNEVVSCAMRYGGTLSEVTMGDKGNNFLFYFGAPTPIEKKEKAAIEWGLEIRDTIKKNFPEIQIKIGISEGRVFSGVVGGAGRHHYTVVGDAVNLAARLTQTAEPNQINISESVWRKESDNFDFIELEVRKLKGKSTPIVVQAVTGRIDDVRRSKGNFFSGRISELEAIWDDLQRSVSKPGMFVVEAGPGVGKSALCEQIISKAENNGWFVVRGQSEITRRFHSYAAWRNIMKQLNIDFSAATAQPRTSSRYPKRPEEKAILHHNFCAEILKHVSGRKTILYLEDLHWFDSLSIELLGAFLNHLNNQKVFILAASRPEWKKEEFVNRPVCSFITLKELDKAGVEKTAAEFLNGKLKSELIQFLYERSQGNPFVLKTVMEHLINNDSLLTIAGKWAMKDARLLPANLSIEDLVAAKIEKLKFSERVYLQTAACMGPTFSVNVLKRILGSKFQQRILDGLHKSGYLQSIENEWATFRQSLLQEVIYYSLPMRRRKILHSRIGKAMETYAGKDKTNLLQNLANHFKLAQNSQKAIYYSLAAADRLLESQSFPEASHYLKIAYELSNHRSDELKWNTGLKYSEALIYSGKIEKALEVSRRLRKRAQKLNLNNVFHKACSLEFDSLRRMSNYSYLPFSLRLLNAKSLEKSTKAKICHFAGSAYFRLGQPDKAEFFLKKAAKLQIDNDEVAMSAYVFLASIAADRGQKEQASEWIQTATQLAGNTGNRYQKIRIQHEWAGILSDTGQPDDAIRILNELLPEAESLGAFYLIGAILTSLGQAEIKAERWDKAISFVNEASALFSHMGMLHGKAETTMLSGVISFYKEDYMKAYDLYMEATNFYESAQENVEACHGYYNLAEVCLKIAKKNEAQIWLNKGLRSFTAESNPQLSTMYRNLRQQLQT